MTKPTNAAILGLGRWGQLLVSSVDTSQKIRFKTAITRTPFKVKKFCAIREIVLSSDLTTALDDDEIDAIVIATPHTQHFAQLLAAAGAGKHVYCEKPWPLNTAQAVNSLRRFAPNTQAMKKLLQDGGLGTPIHIDGHFDANLAANEGKWRDNRMESPAGGMTSLGIHALDMFINLFGQIRDVNVQSKRIASSIDVDDTTLVRLNFENGCTGHLTTISATNILWRITVFCTGGWIEIRDQDKLEVSSMLDGNTKKTFPGYAYPALSTIKAALEAFATDVSGGEAFPISAPEIQHATTALDAIFASAETGKTVSLGRHR